MGEIRKYNRSVFIAVFFILAIVFLSRCVEKNAAASEQTWQSFTGGESCANCHKDIYQNHIRTAHSLTSKPAAAKYILGNFHADSNTYYFNSRISVAMEQRNDSFYQVGYKDAIEKQRKRFDIVFGSGAKGQSYASWTGNRLFQLPITYFSPAHQWANSPGFPGRAVFNRPITSRCLECHATYALQTAGDEKKQQDEFDREKIIYGIDCEKCHGPAASHVDFHTKNPTDTIGKFISNPAKFTRQQSLDLCALCHGGRRNKTKPSFSFKAGDLLSDYFTQDTISTIAAGIDVHGNQFGLLAASKCFSMSQLNCMSCHDIHENEKGKIALFSQRCINCHQAGHEKICKMEDTIGSVIKQNCIDCHMPKEPSRSVAVFLQGEEVPTPALMRTHFIRIYPNETKKVMANLSDLEKTNKK